MPPSRSGRSQRRTDALSRERIVEAAVELLDAAGESGLTFRVLTERLATGPGAIYWHVANRGELLAAATDAVVDAALAAEPAEPTPQARIRALASSLFDTIDAHPWVAAQLSGSSWQAAAPRILEVVGRQVGALGVPEANWFTVTSVLVQYIFGAASQEAANSDVLDDRATYLDAVATTWSQLDPDAYPFIRTIAPQLRDHDDREEFLAGIDLILSGITAQYPPAG
ncbi:TetR/AcrR family transcriptional regulator [Umezawaea endophytica]|uniref:TetR/AcrR family transcriptional regulator C-terminal domain-containing protein n=1 Tax=Umezawaea endophytica TaxID=1654476 RepID=A0A9X2VQ49_9PSEU|nr:TetR/AcrR family transcriptional regulator C-terminal domain-containing protein [Umezawaea endophytica]MCS7480775.1 TetR/AcrR family transcriptional regulator C-terminal domain-containing protein [Umezawaea endophytica]